MTSCGSVSPDSNWKLGNVASPSRSGIAERVLGEGSAAPPALAASSDDVRASARRTRARVDSKRDRGCVIGPSGGESSDVAQAARNIPHFSSRTAGLCCRSLPFVPIPEDRMRSNPSLVLSTLALVSCSALVMADSPATPQPTTTVLDSATIAAMPRNEKLPAGEVGAKAALDASPRHGEWVDVPLKDGGPLHTWIVYPERHDKAPVVMIIHEIFGLSDWIRGVADQLAREGFIAVAPDLVTGFGPNGGGTESLPTRDDVVYYGTAPDSASLVRIKAPVLGLYGGDDARVDATIEPAKRVLDPLHRRYDPHTFDGAGHGFLRAQTQRDGANLRATQQAWPLTIDFLRKNLK